MRLLTAYKDRKREAIRQARKSIKETDRLGAYCFLAYYRYPFKNLEDFIKVTSGEEFYWEYRNRINK